MPITIVGHKNEPNCLFFCSSDSVLKSLCEDLKNRYGEDAATLEFEGNDLSFDEGGSVFAGQDWYTIELDCGKNFKFMPHQYQSLQFKLGAALRSDKDYIVIESWYRSLCLDKSEGQDILRHLIKMQSDLESRAVNHFDKRKQLAEILKDDKKNIFIMAEHLKSDDTTSVH